MADSDEVAKARAYLASIREGDTLQTKELERALELVEDADDIELARSRMNEPVVFIGSVDDLD